MGVSGTDGSSGTLPAPSPEPPPFAIPPLPVPPEFEPPDAPLDAASPPNPLEPSDGSPSPASPPIVPAGVLMPLKEAPPKGALRCRCVLACVPILLGIITGIFRRVSVRSTGTLRSNRGAEPAGRDRLEPSAGFDALGDLDQRGQRYGIARHAEAQQRKGEGDGPDQARRERGLAQPGANGAWGIHHDSCLQNVSRGTCRETGDAVPSPHAHNVPRHRTMLSAIGRTRAERTRHLLDSALRAERSRSALRAHASRLTPAVPGAGRCRAAWIFTPVAPDPYLGRHGPGTESR